MKTFADSALARPGRTNRLGVALAPAPLATLFLVYLGLAGGCIVGQTVPPGPTQAPAQDDCIAWQDRITSLPSSLRETYQRDGVVWTGNSLLVSEAFVRDCTMRIATVEYFGSTIRGQVTEAQREWAKRESRKVSEVLDTVWRRLDSAGDAAFHFEKYALLSGNGLLPSDLGPVVARIIAAEGVSLGLASAVMGKTFPNVEDALLEAAMTAHDAENIVGEIYALAALQAYGHDPVSNLERMQAQPGLTEPMRDVLSRLISRLRRAGRLTIGDLEDVEYVEGP